MVKSSTIDRTWLLLITALMLLVVPELIPWIVPIVIFGWILHVVELAIEEAQRE